MCNSTLYAHWWNKPSCTSTVHTHTHTWMPKHTRTYTYILPVAHAFVQGKMCLAGRELFSVNSYNSSSQTWVLGWAATIPLWPANYCERAYESPHFILSSSWYTEATLGPITSHQPVLSCCSPVSTLFFFFFKLSWIPPNVSEQNTHVRKVSKKRLWDGQEQTNSQSQGGGLSLHMVADEFYLQWCDWRCWGAINCY